MKMKLLRGYFRAKGLLEDFAKEERGGAEIIAIILMIATLLVIKAVTAKKHAGVFAEMAEADKVLYNK